MSENEKITFSPEAFLQIIDHRLLTFWAIRVLTRCLFKHVTKLDSRKMPEYALSIHIPTSQVRQNWLEFSSTTY